MPLATAANLASTETYVDARSRNDTRKVLSLVSDDIELDGPHASVRGKEAFGKYLDKNRSNRGTWGEPYWTEGMDHVAIDGVVKFAFLTVKVVTRFYFEEGGLICRIWVGRVGKTG